MRELVATIAAGILLFTVHGSAQATIRVPACDELGRYGKTPSLNDNDDVLRRYFGVGIREMTLADIDKLIEAATRCESGPTPALPPPTPNSSGLIGQMPKAWVDAEMDANKARVSARAAIFRLSGLRARKQADERVAASQNSAQMRQIREPLRAKMTPIDPDDAKVSFQKTHIGQTEAEFRKQSSLGCSPHNPDDKGSPYIDTDACYNPMAATGLPQFMEKVAGVLAVVVYMFRNPDKALFKIEGVTNSRNYPAWQRAFIEKWGQPKKIQKIALQNRVGAKFENAILTWEPSHNVRITLQQFSDGFPPSGAGGQYDLENSGFQIVHVPTETILILGSTDKL